MSLKASDILKNLQSSDLWQQHQPKQEKDEPVNTNRTDPDTPVDRSAPPVDLPQAHFSKAINPHRDL